MNRKDKAKERRKKRNRAIGLKNQRRHDRKTGVVQRPEKRPDQVYVTKKGECYHPFWCNAVNGLWLSGSESLRTTTRVQANLDGYLLCMLCDDLQRIEPEAAAHLDAIAGERGIDGEEDE